MDVSNHGPVTGPRHTCCENETPRDVTRKTGVKFGPGCSERLCAYARSVAHFPTAIKEFEWRNGYFWNISEEAEEKGEPDPCPTHTRYCNLGLVE